jgi:hypothetical protein
MLNQTGADDQIHTFTPERDASRIRANSLRSGQIGRWNEIGTQNISTMILQRQTISSKSTSQVEHPPSLQIHPSAL